MKNGQDYNNRENEASGGLCEATGRRLASLAYFVYNNFYIKGI